jgi:hypothetical protein
MRQIPFLEQDIFFLAQHVTKNITTKRRAMTGF